MEDSRPRSTPPPSTPPPPHPPAVSANPSPPRFAPIHPIPRLIPHPSLYSAFCPFCTYSTYRTHCTYCSTYCTYNAVYIVDTMHVFLIISVDTCSTYCAYSTIHFVQTIQDIQYSTVHTVVHTVQCSPIQYKYNVSLAFSEFKSCGFMYST